MRKITREIVQSWARFQPRIIGNTATDGETIWLHGNAIAWKAGDTDTLALTLAGWNTVTTRERLNGVLNFYGFKYRFAQRNWEPVLIIGRDVIDTGEFERVYFNLHTQRLTELAFVCRTERD